jgi:hypothetical protein
MKKVTGAVQRRLVRREARADAQIQHPNVAQVIHYGEQDGECFYGMELVHWSQRCSHAPRKYDGSASGVDVALVGG